KGYLIAVGDLVAVRVFGHDDLSVRERVRDDGKISLPILKDVDAAGLAPQVLGEQVRARLKDYVNAPVVTVTVAESRPLIISVLGEVTRPGQYTLEKGSGALEALASAGGLTDYAHRDRIFILRRQSPPVRIRTTFSGLSQGQGRASALRLLLQRTFFGSSLASGNATQQAGQLRLGAHLAPTTVLSWHTIAEWGMVDYSPLSGAPIASPVSLPSQRFVNTLALETMLDL